MAKTYDSNQISVVFGGHIVQGFADGEFLNAERDEALWNLTTGTSGESARAKNNKKAGTIVLLVLQTSISNDIFSGFHLADEQNNGGQNPFLCRDGLGSTLIEASNAWVQKVAKVTFSNEITAREWTIRTGDLSVLVGGVQFENP